MNGADRVNDVGTDTTVRVRPSKSATIYDIAKLAGVNPSTVSRALSKPGRISAKMEKRIQDAARQLDYRANPMARALPTGRTMTIALIIADITNPMFSQVMRGAERAARRSGYTLVLSESQESGTRETEAIERVAPSVDGLVLVSTRLDDQKIRMLAAQKPLVLINRRVESISAIIPDVVPGVDAALDQLTGYGHKSIAYLSGPANSWMNGTRWIKLRDHAVARGVRIEKIEPGAPTLERGRSALTRVRESGATAVVAYNDLMAIGLMQAAHKEGVQVPGGLSVVGFDNIFGSDFTSPPLTTIGAPLDLVGERAVQTTLTLVAQENGEVTTDTPGSAPLVTSLIARGSTGPVEKV